MSECFNSSYELKAHVEIEVKKPKKYLTSCLLAVVIPPSTRDHVLLFKPLDPTTSFFPFRFCCVSVVATLQRINSSSGLKRYNW